MAGSPRAILTARVALRPGVITLTQPKVPEAKIRGPQKGFQWVILGLKKVSGFLEGVRRGSVGPPGPPELAALASTLAACPAP